MRELWLMRHGAAEGTSPSGDAGRRLTRDGERTSRLVAVALARAGVQADALWCSSFERAQQTARIVADALPGAGAPVVDERFTPHGHAPACAERLFRADARRLLLVSHLPLIPAVTAELLGANAHLDVGTSSVVHLLVLGADEARGSCVLAGLYRADTLAALSSV